MDPTPSGWGGGVGIERARHQLTVSCILCVVQRVSASSPRPVVRRPPLGWLMFVPSFKKLSRAALPPTSKHSIYANEGGSSIPLRCSTGHITLFYHQLLIVARDHRHLRHGHISASSGSVDGRPPKNCVFIHTRLRHSGGLPFRSCR